jgi:transcriptional regulator with XRE-family HTH domain
MAAGSAISTHMASTSVMWEDYYENLHGAYRALRETFQCSALSQDDLAKTLGVSKSRVSRVLSGKENLTVKVLSHFGTAMRCRLSVVFVPYDQVSLSNQFFLTVNRLLPGLGTEGISGTTKAQVNYVTDKVLAMTA